MRSTCAAQGASRAHLVRHFQVDVGGGVLEVLALRLLLLGQVLDLLNACGKKGRREGRKSRGKEG